MHDTIRRFIVAKYRTLATNVGYYAAARNLRKQGEPSADS